MDISGTGWKHITMFDRQYSPEKQAEGLAISQAIVYGHCDKCGFLPQCLRRVRRFNFLCLHGVCGARQKSLQICKRRKPDEMRELHQIR